MAGEDYDKTTDALDALTGTRDVSGLLVSVGYDLNRPLQEPAYLWRYRFGDPAVATYYRASISDEVERERTVRSLLTTLIDLRLDGELFDPVIGRLARQLGDHDTARTVEQRLATHQELANIQIDASVLLTIAVTWDSSDIYLAEQLTTITDRLRVIGLAHTAVVCGIGAVDLLHSHASPPAAVSGAAHHSLGAAYWARGDHDQAIEHLTQALEHRRLLFDQAPTPTHRSDLAPTLNNLGAAHLARGDHDQAIEHLTQALEHLRRLFDQAPTPTHRSDLAPTLNNLGAAYRARGDHDQAIERYTVALEHLRLLFDQAPTPAHRSNLAAGLNNLGVAHLARGDHDQAIERYTVALEHRRLLFDQAPTPAQRSDLAATLNNLGAAYRARGDHDQAIEHLTQALEHRRLLFDQAPTPAHRGAVASTMTALEALTSVKQRAIDESSPPTIDGPPDEPS